MRRLAWVLVVIGVSLLGLGVVAQEESGPVNIAFIFDASGSMRAGMEGRTRLAVAQDAMAQLVAGLSPGTNASLWVYGHRLSQDDPAASCQDIENVIALGPVDASQFEATMRQINAIGYTPITTSMQLAAQTLVDQVGARNTIVLVSDGEETCGGSPCLMAQALKAANIELTVNTIGFAADDVTRQQLQCIAEVTGGTYFDAPDAQQLGEALQAAVALPGTVQIVDADGNVQWNIGFTLQPADGSGTAIDYLGTATLPAGDYIAHVSSDPPVDTTVSVASEETASIVVALPEVTGLTMVNLAGVPLPDLSFSAALPDSGEPLYGTGTLEVAPGEYHVEVNTAFPQVLDVSVPDGVTVPVAVNDEEGVIRIVNLAGEPLPEMYFSVVDPVSGEAVYGQGVMRVPPGAYPVEVRTAFSTLANAIIEDGQTVDVAVNASEGTIVLVNLSGETLSDVSFNITDPATNEVYYAQGEITVPPGTYAVNVPIVPPIDVSLTVEAGQRLEVPINNETGTVRIVDLAGNPLPDLSFTITDPSSGTSAYAVGELQVPTGEYTVEVNTSFPIDTTASVQSGEVTDIAVDDAAGTIRLVDENGRPLNDLALEVWLPDDSQSIYGAGPITVPPGEYRVQLQLGFDYEVNVTVVDGETTEVTVPSTGMIQLVDATGAPLDEPLFSVEEVETGEGTSAHGSLELPPGRYEVRVYTEFPFTVEVEVVAGETTEVVVGATGTIQLVDGLGRAQSSVRFSIQRLDSDDITSAAGSIDVPPGLYHLSVNSAKNFELDVQVVEGEVTAVNVANQSTDRPAP